MFAYLLVCDALVPPSAPSLRALHAVNDPSREVTLVTLSAFEA